MRSRVFKILAMTLMVVVMLGTAVLPSASAQDGYAPIPVSRDCTDVPIPGLALDGVDVVVLLPEVYLECVVNVLVEANGVLYDGPVPASLALRLPLSPLPPGELTITATATTVDNVKKIATLTLTADQVAAINAALGVPGGLQPAPGQGVAPGIAVPVPGLARTGNTVSTPVAAGAALIGAGGLALLVARKRRQDHEIW